MDGLPVECIETIFMFYVFDPNSFALPARDDLLVRRQRPSRRQGHYPLSRSKSLAAVGVFSAMT
ncbi:MAG: hypothetical protein B7Y35_03365 [Sphingomonadales bacterium 28-64-96]|nr:MAG: hypothetical protein B7Y35_03365 [Sphingomonadales bacterium 28-64-96]